MQGSASPRRGGLRTPANETLPPPGDRPIRPPGVPLPPMIMLCLGLRTASQCGRGDRAPPRKSPFALFPGISPLGHLTLDSPSPRRGGLRTPARKALASPGHIAARPPVVRSPLHDHVMPRLAPGPHLRTRGARPSDKTAFPLIPGLSALGHLALDGPSPRRGGSARPPTTFPLDRGIAPLGHRAFLCPR